MKTSFCPDLRATMTFIDKQTKSILSLIPILRKTANISPFQANIEWCFLIANCMSLLLNGWSKIHKQFDYIILFWALRRLSDILRSEKNLHILWSPLTKITHSAFGVECKYINCHCYLACLRTIKVWKPILNHPNFHILQLSADHGNI